MSPARRNLSALGAVVLALAVAERGADWLRRESRGRAAMADAARLRVEAELASRQRVLEVERRALGQYGAFLEAWRPHLPSAGPEPADPVGTWLAALEGRAAAIPLATSHKVTPPPTVHRGGGGAWPVQPLTLRVSGDLGGILAWLGRVEEDFPLARVDGFQLTRHGRGGAALTVSFLQPVAERRPAAAAGGTGR